MTPSNSFGDSFDPSFPRPRRITITVADDTYQRLAQQSDEQGRSLSHLAAYLIETALQAAPPATRCAG